MSSISSYTPNSFFFTDPFVMTQSVDQTFGPVSTDIFRLTNKFNITNSDTNAYAICTGTILVQPQANNGSKVNLILRPFKQPIQGLNIKYFIYRGLSIDDFFNGNDIIAATLETSDFINKINKSFNAYYTKIGIDPPVFLAKYIGFDQANQPANTLIDDLFFKITEHTDSSHETETDITAFELPLIDGGMSLGSFVSGECGIDVVLNYGEYKLSSSDQFVFDLNYARISDKIIDLSTVSDDFQKKLLKEQIFQFLDFSAYYGFHCVNGNVITLNTGSRVNNKGSDIYNNVLLNFYTKNALYLYIQSDRTRSYNFYSNYNISDINSNSLMIGPTADSLTESSYGILGWPLIINNTAQNSAGNNNSLFLQLVTDNNDNVVLYAQTGSIVNDQKNNFCGPDDLQLPVNNDGTLSIYTKKIHLSYPAIADGSSTLNISTFIILIYQGVLYNYDITQPDQTSITAQPGFFDDIFEINNAIPILKGGDNLSYQTISYEKVKLINYYHDQIQYGASAMQTVVINDVLATTNPANPNLDRVTYVSEPVDTLNDGSATTGKVTSDTQSYPSLSGSVTGDNSYQLPLPFYYINVQFTDDTQSINGLEIKSSDNSIPTKLILGITKAENNSLLALNNVQALVNTRLFSINLFDVGADLVSVENRLYQKYKAGMVGEDSDGKLQLLLPDTDVIIYSTDQKYYYSKNYSEYMTVNSTITGNILDLDNAL
jgi:hypothetical protein